MPTIDIDYPELERLLNVKLNGDMAKLDDILAYVKAEVKGFNEKECSVSIEMKDTNRPDLWSVEGLSRALRYLNLEKGIKRIILANLPEVSKREIIRHSTLHLLLHRQGIHLSDTTIKELCTFRTSHQTNGRSRQNTIGIYNLDPLNLNRIHRR
jgi:phenylalanyl-tRNA synthetase beta chain